MKRMILLVTMILILAVLYGIRVNAETVGWVNPTMYTDGVAIPAAKQAQLSTEIQYRILPNATFTTYGTATSGANGLVGAYVTPGGSASNWRMRTISVADNNSMSAWSSEFPFVRAYQSPAVGSGLTVN